MKIIILFCCDCFIIYIVLYMLPLFDVSDLSLVSLNWSKHRLSSKISARGWLSAVTVQSDQDDKIVIFGGAAERLWHNDAYVLIPSPGATDTWKCAVADISGETPEPRESFACVVAGRDMWIFGGHSGTARYDTTICVKDVYHLQGLR